MSNVEVIGECKGAELGKRTFLPGIVIKSFCPKCGAPWKKDLRHDHLYHPKIGVPVDAYGYCERCDHEWRVMVVLHLTVEPAP